MHSIKEIFVIGNGPSSSHTMGPSFACDRILEKYPDAKRIDVTLFGSLALTGKGHLTDVIIDKKLKKIEHTIIFDEKSETNHPNTMVFKVTLKDGKIKEDKVVSIGGGTISINGELPLGEEKYPHHTMKDILSYCQKEKMSLSDYVRKFDDPDIDAYIGNVITTMERAIERGESKSGILPGSLKIKRKAKEMLVASKRENLPKDDIHLKAIIASYAVSEENAAGGIVVTAPTCGSAGVLPGVLTYLKSFHHTRKRLIDCFLVAGLIGAVAKTNASVSGAECGCQAEIGVACAMGAGMASCFYGNSNEGIIQAAEIALEHSLGLTCDPVQGYVQIPCIQRCAVFALKAINSAKVAEVLPHQDARIAFDDVVETMYRTGKDLNSDYRETGIGGLNKIGKRC